MSVEELEERDMHTVEHDVHDHLAEELGTELGTANDANGCVAARNAPMAQHRLQ
jgi:hypothetical protein